MKGQVLLVGALEVDLVAQLYAHALDRTEWKVWGGQGVSSKEAKRAKCQRRMRPELSKDEGVRSPVNKRRPEDESK